MSRRRRKPRAKQGSIPLPMPFPKTFRSLPKAKFTILTEFSPSVDVLQKICEKVLACAQVSPEEKEN